MFVTHNVGVTAQSSTEGKERDQLLGVAASPEEVSRPSREISSYKTANHLSGSQHRPYHQRLETPKTSCTCYNTMATQAKKEGKEGNTRLQHNKYFTTKP